MTLWLPHGLRSVDCASGFANRASGAGWSALARRFGTNERLERRRERILTQQVIALKSSSRLGGGEGDYATKLLVSVEGFYTGGVRALGTPRVLVPWSEIVWLSEQRSLASDKSGKHIRRRMCRHSNAPTDAGRLPFVRIAGLDSLASRAES